MEQDNNKKNMTERSDTVEILPPSANDDPPLYIPIRDFSEHYRKQQDVPPQEPPQEPAPQKSAEQKYIESIKSTSQKQAAKKTERKKTVIYTALICAFCLLIGSGSGVLSARLTVKQATAQFSEALARLSSENAAPAPITLSQPLYTTGTSAVPSTTPAPTTAAPTKPSADSSAVISSNIPEAVASTNAAVAKTARDIYADVVDSVVGISSTISISTNFFGQSFSGTSTGSGFVVTSDGYILTNYHVVEGGSNYRVSFHDGSEKSAELVGYDSDNDIAVLKTDAHDLTPVDLGDSDELYVGDTVLIIGNPLGTLSYTLTSGTVSALNRVIADDASCVNMFQTDAAINSGNSGGPALNMDGKVVGIVTSKYADSTIEGLAFCIPIDDIKSAVMDILTDGYPRRKPSLDLSAQTLSAASAARYGLVKGAYIVALGDGGAAAASGIAQGDVITSLNGAQINSVADLRVAMLDKEAGETVTLTVYRSGQTQDISVRLNEKVQTTTSRTGYTGVYDL